MVQSRAYTTRVFQDRNSNPMALYRIVQFLGLVGSSGPSQSTSYWGSAVALVGMVVTRCDSDMWSEAREGRTVNVLPSASWSACVSTEETDSAIESVSRDGNSVFVGHFLWELVGDRCDDIPNVWNSGETVRRGFNSARLISHLVRSAQNERSSFPARN